MAGKLKRGRKPSGLELRTAELSFSLTEEDAQWFSEVADELGFLSRGQMLTAIFERLRMGGLAPAVWFKVGWQLAKVRQERGTRESAGFYNPFESLPPFELREKPRPKPTLPEGGPAAEEIPNVLRELEKQLQPT